VPLDGDGDEVGVGVGVDVGVGVGVTDGGVACGLGLGVAFISMTMPALLEPEIVKTFTDTPVVGIPSGTLHMMTVSDQLL